MPPAPAWHAARGPAVPRPAVSPPSTGGSWLARLLRTLPLRYSRAAGLLSLPGPRSEEDVVQLSQATLLGGDAPYFESRCVLLLWRWNHAAGMSQAESELTRCCSSCLGHAHIAAPAGCACRLAVPSLSTIAAIVAGVGLLLMTRIPGVRLVLGRGITLKAQTCPGNALAGSTCVRPV